MADRCEIGIGLLAYSGQGVVKSIHAGSHDSTRALVGSKRTGEGKCLQENAADVQYAEAAIW